MATLSSLLSMDPEPSVSRGPIERLLDLLILFLSQRVLFFATSVETAANHAVEIIHQCRTTGRKAGMLEDVYLN